jgi:hypothetical protein
MIKRWRHAARAFAGFEPSLEPQRIIGIMNKHGEFLYIQGDLGEISGFPVGIKFSDFCNQIISPL